MNANTAVSSKVTMLKCSKCGKLYPNGTKGSQCTGKVEKFVSSTYDKGKTKLVKSSVDCEGELVYTNGEVFRREHDYSPTFYRNMKRRGLNPLSAKDIEQYRAERRAAQRKRRKKQQDKASMQRVLRRSGGKKTKYKKGKKG